MEQPNIETLLDASAALNGDAPVDETPANDPPADENTLDAEILTEGGEPNPDEPVIDEPAKEGDEEVVAEPEAVEIAVPEFATETPQLVEQVKELVDKYDIPAPLQASIDTVLAKLAEAPDNAFTDYGEPEDVKTVLEQFNFLNSDRPLDNGKHRPNTDKFIENIDPDRRAWLAHDLGEQPSVHYPGKTLAEEAIINRFGREGDSVAEVLSRYETFTRAMQSGIMQTDVPEFIPVEMHEAFNRLDEDRRYAIAALDREDDTASIETAVKELSMIQRGIDLDRKETQRTLADKAAVEQTFSNTVIQKESAFFDTFREQFSTKLASEVKFSEDTKLQGMYAKQNVALLTACLEPSGDWARNALKEAGIEFDNGKAQGLLQAIHNSAITMTKHEMAKNGNGEPLNKVELNKAQSDFRKTTDALRDFSDNIIKQMAKATTGKVDAPVKEPVKARIVPKGVATTAKKPINTMPPPSVAYGSPEWDRWFAKQTLAEQAAKARQYQSI